MSRPRRRRQPCPIKHPVLNRLAYVLGGDSVSPREVGNRPCELEHAAVRPRGEAELGDGLAQKRLRRLAQPAVAADVARRHVRVRVHPRVIAETLALDPAGRFHTGTDGRARLRRWPTPRQLTGRHSWHVQMDVDPIEQRTRDPRSVARDRSRLATTLPQRVTQVSAQAPLPFPFCCLTLRSQKRLPRAYPQVLSTIGDHLRKRRLDLGLLQRQVADQLGADPCSVTNWELNRRNQCFVSYRGSFGSSDTLPGPPTGR
jgi:hypothetical protein